MGIEGRQSTRVARGVKSKVVDSGHRRGVIGDLRLEDGVSWWRSRPDCDVIGRRYGVFVAGRSPGGG